jgi:hypothetical protein
MKTVRIRKDLVDFLDGNIKYNWQDKGIFDRKASPATTTELLEFYNLVSRHGTSSHQIGNILSKDKNIIKVGLVRKAGLTSGAYEICEWASVTWVLDNLPDRGSNEIVYESTIGKLQSCIIPVESLERVRRLQDESLDELLV